MATLKKSAVDKMNAYYKRVGYTQKDEEDEDKTSSPRQDTTPSTQQNTTTKHTLKHSAVEKMDAYQKRMKSTTARNATNRDRDDAGVRDRFAQRHPEYTGGEAGEANRARNSEKMFRQAAGTTNYYSETAKQIKALETQFDALDQERADITRTRAGYMRGYGSEQGNGQRDRLKKIDTQIRDLKKQLEDLTPAYDSDTVEGLQKTLENANTALISRWSTSDDFEAYAKERQDALNRQGSALQSLIEYYEQNPSQELQSRLQKAYNQYEKDRTDYNKAVEEYAALADTFNAALNEYNDYVDIAKSDASGLEIAGDAALKGMSSINRGVTYTLALPEKVLGMIFPGARGPLSDVADYAADLDAYHANELADSTYGRGTIVKTAADLGAATVAALPNAILAILSSGTSLAGQGATLATGAANSGLASTIGTSIKAMANNPMYWSSFLQTAGTDFEEAKEGGASDVQALATAIISSGLNAAVEIGGGIETLPEQVRRGGASAVKEWVKSMYDEGKEEVIQDIITGITQKVVYDTDKTLFTGEDPIVDPASLRQDFLMGAGVGGILGGGQIAANSALNAAANRISSNQHTEAGSQYQAAADGEAVNGHKNSAVSVNVEITDDVATSDTRRIRSLISANMNQVKTFVQNALQNKNKQQYLKLSDVDPSLVQALKSQGIDISDYAHVLKDNDIRHIDSSHGSKSNAKYKVTVDDIAGVQNVIDNYDNLYLGYNTKAGNPTIVYEYSDGRRTFYVEEVLEAGGLSSKQMVIVGADSKPSFLKKYKKISSVSDTDVTAQSRTTGQSPLGNHVQDAETTAETQRINTSHPQEGKISGYKPSASTESIPQPAQSYNPNFNQNQGGDTGSPAGRTGTRQAVRKATGYGEYGARAFNQIVEDVGQSPDRVRMEFQSAYEAGLTNLPRERASLISHVQEIAYNAGRQDAIMSMKKATARGTTVWSKGGGVIENEYSGKLDTQTHDTIQKIGKSTGTKILFEDIPAEKNANGYYRDSTGTIHIDVNATDPVMTVVKHELTHRMQALAPKEYRQFRDYAVQVMSEYGWSKNRSHTDVESQQYAYRDASGGNVNLTTEEAMDEMAANFTEKIFTDEKALNDFVNDVTQKPEHRTMGQKFFQAVREFIDKVKRIFKGDKAKMDDATQEQFGATVSRLEKAEALWKKAYHASEKNAQEISQKAQKNTDQAAGNVRFSLKDQKIPTYEDLIAKPDMVVVDISTPQTTGTFAERRNQIRNQAQKVIKKPYLNKDTDTQIFITKGSYTHAFSNNAGELNLNATEHLPELIENAVLTHAEPPTHGSNYADGVYTFFAAAGAKNVLPVKLKVKEYAVKGQDLPANIKAYFKENPEKYAAVYDSVVLEVLEIEESPIGSGKDMNRNGPFLAPNGLSTIKVADLLDLVNGNARKYIPSANDPAAFSLKGQRELLQQYREQYGLIPEGEKPYRKAQIPKKTGENQHVSQTVRTVMEAKATPDEAIPDIESLVADGSFSYEAITDKQAIQDADGTIRRNGWDASLRGWFDSVKKGEVSKANTALGWALYNNAANSGNIKTALDILQAMAGHQRNAAQALQATRILKKLSPETQLYQVQRSVESLQEELNKRYGKKNKTELKINEELAKRFTEAKTQAERDELMKDIYRDIGSQMPASFIDKWNAWRYLAMLGNVRTHVRNVVGNAGFVPVVGIKNATATAIEAAVHRVSGGRLNRSKAAGTFTSKSGRSLLKAAWSDFDNVQDIAMSGGKYSDFANANRYIEEGRRIFRLKPLETVRKGNGKLLDLEDAWFSRPHYAYAMAQYCRANNITAEQLSGGKAIEPARRYAIHEAQKATYRDTNAFSQMVSGWGRSTGDTNAAKKAFNVAVEGILPFRKTPANILARGVEYSPIGLIKSLSYDLAQVKNGKMTGAEAIDNISAGLTGTGLVALGALLASFGLIRGHGGGDEDKKRFEETLGHQAYSLELPGGASVTLDWLAPEALPFFIGVNLWEQAGASTENVTLSDILTAASTVTEPLLEMSCLQSLNDVFDSVGYASANDLDALPAALASAATSYLTQGLPAILGQAERSGQDVRMTTYTEKNAFLTPDMQYALGSASARTPGWDFNQIPYIDAWGRKETTGSTLERIGHNFLNPAYTSDVKTSKMEEELLRLYDATGERSVFPSRADKYFTEDGARKDLTAEEYVRYATLKGQKSFALLTELTESKQYKELSDSEKVHAIEDTYDMANQQAKAAVSKYDPDSWVAKSDGMNIPAYLAFRANLDTIRDENDGKLKQADVATLLTSLELDDEDRWSLYFSQYDGKEAHEAHNMGLDAETYLEFKAATSDMTADKDSEGNSIPGTKKEKVIDYMNTMGLTQDEYDALLEIAGYKSDDEQKSGFGSSSFGSSSFGSSSFGKSSFGR